MSTAKNWIETESHDENYKVVDKYAVYVKKNGTIVEHLPKGSNGWFAKTIFLFLRADKFSSSTAAVEGKATD